MTADCTSVTADCTSMTAESAVLSPRLRRVAEDTRGFMPVDEGLALHEAAASLAVEGSLLEVGSYCGKSAVYLGAAAQKCGRLLFCVDHHRGSEENQPGWEHHDPEVVDPSAGVIDTLPFFRRAIRAAGLEDVVVAVVGTRLTWLLSGVRRWLCCSSTAVMVPNPPDAITRDGHRMWYRAGCWPSTMCSRIPKPGGDHPTKCT